MDDGSAAIPPGALTLRNEFASVGVAVDTQGNGPRLQIVNHQNGMAIYLDPLELASLTWLEHARLGPFLDPSRTGWSSDAGGPHEHDH
jgi:hypothetical protein